ncbi:MAG: histidine--tRNA ligase [Rickettsiales bacterium]
MSSLQPIRGTHDLHGEAMARHRLIMDTAARVAALYGFDEVAPPMFEMTEVFHRTLGETSDVVSKETYTFTDRGGDSITLRPEFTASIVRLLISEGLTQQLPFKAFYAGPAFRYERPQKGRQRQFHQIGIETLGADSASADAEVIACGVRILQELGVAEGTRLEINTLGDMESRQNYRDALVNYFAAHKSDLSPESQVRLEKNPLRILDSKQEQDRGIVAGAPQLEAYLTKIAASWFARVQESLASVGISYMVSPRLVRGLDYYTHTVWEIKTDALGAQDTVLAGGRYDGLVAQMGGPEIPGVGWAAGIERLALLLEAKGRRPEEAKPLAVVIPLSDGEEKAAFIQLEALRKQNIRAEMLPPGALGKRLKKADKLGAHYALVLGETEVKDGTVTLRDLKEGTQKTVKHEEIVHTLG